MPYVIFKKDETQLDVKKLRYRRYENIWDIRYKEIKDEPSRSVYIQTPALKLSLLEEDDNYFYLICRINNNDEKFWDLIQNLDMATIEEMSEDCVSWGFRDDTPLTFIEKRFIPTLKMSSINYEYSLHLVVPKSVKLDIYDQNGIPISMNLIKRDYKLAMLLLLDGVEFKNNYFSLKFLVEQMKVKVPDDLDKDTDIDQKKDNQDNQNDQTKKNSECLLNDSEDDERVSQYYNDVTKYSNKPRQELYGEDNDVIIDEDDEVIETKEQSKEQSIEQSKEQSKEQYIKDDILSIKQELQEIKVDTNRLIESNDNKDEDMKSEHIEESLKKESRRREEETGRKEDIKPIEVKKELRTKEESRHKEVSRKNDESKRNDDTRSVRKNSHKEETKNKNE